MSAPDAPRAFGEIATRLLLVEDNDGDARLVAETLRRDRGARMALSRAATLSEGLTALARGRFDCVLLDLTLPDADDLAGVAALREADPRLPVVVLTGYDESLAISALAAGAQDYLVKGRDLSLVARSVRYAVERYRIDAALRARDAQLADSHRLARMGTWEWDVSRGRVLLSQELMDLLGVATPSVDAASAFRAVHPDDRGDVARVLERARGVGGRFAFAARLRAGSREIATRHIGERRRRAGGAGTVLVGTMQDVSEAYAAEVALRASEHRYRTVVETATEGVWVFGVDGTTTFANHRMAELLGLAPDDLLGRALADFAADECAGAAAELLRGATGCAAERGELTMRRADGELVHVAISVRGLWHGATYAGAVAMMSDITERRLDDERLRVRHDVVTTLGRATALHDALGDVLRRVAPVLGCGYGEVWHRRPGDQQLERVVAHDPGGASAESTADPAPPRVAVGHGAVGEAWGTGETSVAMLAGPGGPGGRAAGAVHAVPVSSNGVVLAVVAFYVATDRPSKHRDGVLADLAAALADFAVRWQAEQMKDVFLTAVSHELRTPLAALIGHATTLQQHADQLTATQRADCLDRVVRNASRLNDLLGDLLDVDRLSRGVVEPRRLPVRLDEVVRRVVTSLDPDSGRTTVDLAPCVANVDATKVERIVENLVVNAAKYAPAGSLIAVRLETDADTALIIVDDRGPGVPDPLKSTVFEPFKRGEHVQRHQPGTGVGLSLVAGFARLHGGHAWVEDRSGGGASFRVTLPTGISAETGVPAQRAEAATGAVGASPR